MWQVVGVYDLRSVFESLKITCLVGDGRWKKEHDGFFEPLRLAVRSRVRWPKGPR